MVSFIKNYADQTYALMHITTGRLRLRSQGVDATPA